MGGYVLCEDGPRVILGGHGERSLLEVKEGATIRFWTDTGLLEGVLRGQPLLLSDAFGYCAINSRGEAAHLEYGVEGRALETCDIPLGKLAEALGWVKRLEAPDA